MKINGGARIGDFNVTAPFATLTLNYNYIIVEYCFLAFKDKLVFEKDEIDSIVQYTGIMSTGIKINHCKSKRG